LFPSSTFPTVLFCNKKDWVLEELVAVRRTFYVIRVRSSRHIDCSSVIDQNFLELIQDDWYCKRRNTNMSQNTGSTNFPGTTPSSTSGTGSSPTGSGTGTGAATGLAQTAQEYGGKITEAATQAKEYVTDKVGVVGDKIKELQNADLAEITENCKDYARKNPGQAILISAAAGLLVGLILRGRR
jgi:ElaB/YqjD/DUF883 family membrane-anchored ribosome-binding protein